MSDPRMNRQGGPPPNQQNLQRIPSNGMHHGGGPPSGHHPGQQQHQMHGGPPPHHGGYGGPPPQHSPHQHVQHHPGMPPPHHGGHHGQYQHPSHHPRQHDRPPPPGHGGYGRPPPGHIDHRGGPPQHQGHPQHGGRIPPPPGQGGPPPGAGGVPSRGFAGWQQPQRDYDTRRQMIAQIVRLLQQRKPDAPREWLQKLPDMARRLEDKLYRYAQTEEEYKDRSSLKQRLQFIALKMAEHRPQNGQGGPPSHPPGAPGQRGMGSGPPGGHPPRGPGGAPPPQQANSHPPAKGLKGGRKPSASSAAGRGRGMVRSGSGQAKPPGGPQDQMNRPPQQGYPPHYQNHPHGAPPGGYPPGHPGARGPPSHGGQYHQPPGGYPPGHPQHQMSHPPHSGGPPGHHPPQAMGGRPPSQQSQNPQHQQVLRQQQQRLLLLRHASKCPVNAPDVCPKTPHCKQMKELWQHIAKCKDNHCRFAHCVSSRYVLSHYHRCKNPQCEVCRPVKDAIHNQMPSDGHQGGPPTGDIARQPSFGDSGGHIMPPHGGGMPPRGPPQQMPPGSTHPQGGSHHPQMPPHHQPPQAHAGPASSTAPKKPIKRQNSKQAPKKGASAGQPDTANLIHQLKVEREKAEALARAHNQKVRELEEKMKALQQQHSEGNIQPGGAPPPAAGGKNSGKRKPAAKRRPSASASKSGGMKKESLSRQHSVASDSGNARPPPPAAANAAVAAPQQMQQHHQQMAMRPGAPGHGVPPSHPAYNKQPPPHAIQQHPQQAMQPHPQQQQRPFVNSAFSGTISLINTFHRDEIRQHISSLVRFSALIKPSELKQRLFPLLRKQLDQQFAYIFLKPVDPVAMDIPDYFDVIKNPMDLTTIRRRLEGSFYKTMKAFAADMLLVYDNAILYNPETPDGFGVNETAKEYAQTFVNDFNKLLLELKAEENIKRTNKDACRLCGGGQFTFEPAVLYCNGKCNSKIKRNAQYYTTPDNKMFWCVPCYNNYLKDRIPTEDGNEIEKSKLEKKKNAELAEESWVQCNQCNRWFHQICAMFNSRNEESKNSQYYCPMCILRYLDKYRIDRIPESRTNTRGFRAKDLQRTKFSDYIEERLTGRILKERKEQAKSKGLSLGDIPEPGELTVRVVLHKDTEVFPRSNLERLYKEAPYNYPRSFPHKVKCVLMFQNIDGVDVLFFALYTQSYGSDCPAPNQRCVYIAYLDSVFYMEPRFLRTPMYQELLIATLDYEKKRGHTKAFIWACPPLAGDDYILYCHPKDQKTQKAEMLRLWYIRLLEDARKRGIVVSVDNLYDAYMRRLPNPCGIPNFDGDYWPGVTEQYVEELEKEKIDPKSLAPRAKRAISRSKNSNNKKGNSKSKKAKGNKLKKKTKKSKIRSSSRPQSQDDNNDNDDDDEDESNPLWPPPPPAKWLEIPQQDALTAKIGECIKQMKDDFFVVYMHHICAECVAHLDQPDTLFWLPEAYREGMGSLDLSKNKYAPPYALCHTCYMKAYEKEFGKEPELKLPPTIDEVTAKEKAEKAEKAKKDEEEKKAGEKRKVEESGDTTIKNEPEQKKMKEEQKPLSEKNGTTKEENGEKKDSEKNGSRLETRVGVGGEER
uniref:histone acetyltransferase n=1 Tax=Mucochytrium quahogii TaxID=96639 RepID=A0A7S2W510_9STRA|mmetsp:Transcript_13104/g.28369  ORF Transcript_13104/g.28369 Transcript_13104/m.28369 type:complete len:1592 (+) Transcript_13104:364-5139(+)